MSICPCIAKIFVFCIQNPVAGLHAILHTQKMQQTVHLPGRKTVILSNYRNWQISFALKNRVKITAFLRQKFIFCTFQPLRRQSFKLAILSFISDYLKLSIDFLLKVWYNCQRRCYYVDRCICF